jgi:hypothetical protein
MLPGKPPGDSPAAAFFQAPPLPRAPLFNL